MAIFQQVQEAFRFVLEGAARAFTPNKDMYPATGLQPFEGDPYEQRREAN